MNPLRDTPIDGQPRPMRLVLGRAVGVTWRDTGRHVVLLKADSDEAHVLGGGAAEIWRLSGHDLSVEEVLAAFAATALEGLQSGVENCIRELLDAEILVERVSL